MKEYFEHLESLPHLHSFSLLNSHPLPFLNVFVTVQTYVLTTCLIPRFPEWKKQMSCFWLAPIRALRPRFLMPEFGRGLYSLVVNKHANPSGFDPVLRWSHRRVVESVHPGGRAGFSSPFSKGNGVKCVERRCLFSL